MKTWVCIVAALAIGVAAWPAAAEDGGWKMPNLNPFAGKSGAASGPPTSGWKMPNLLPKTSSLSKSNSKKHRPNEPGTLSKMSQGTQRFFAKTADALNPFDDKPVEQPAITGSNSIFTQQRKAEAKKDSGVSPASWFGGEKKDSKDKSVNDFLSRPRPY